MAIINLFRAKPKNDGRLVLAIFLALFFSGSWRLLLVVFSKLDNILASRSHHPRSNTSPLTSKSLSVTIFGSYHARPDGFWDRWLPLFDSVYCLIILIPGFLELIAPFLTLSWQTLTILSLILFILLQFRCIIIIFTQFSLLLANSTAFTSGQTYIPLHYYLRTRPRLRQLGLIGRNLLVE